MTEEIQGVIFDFNGTMFFDKEFHEQAWRSFLEQLIGRGIGDAEFQTYVHGRNAKDTLSYFLRRALTKEEVTDLEEEKEVIYRRLCLNCPEKLHLAEGLPKFLNRLKQAGLPMTIATAAGWNNVCFFFEQFNLERWFDVDKVVYNNGRIPGKPEPDVYRRAAEHIQIPITQCVVFEDARSGIEAAKRAGAGRIIGVASMLSREELLACGAEHTVMNYCDHSLTSWKWGSDRQR